MLLAGTLVYSLPDERKGNHGVLYLDYHSHALPCAQNHINAYLSQTQLKMAISCAPLRLLYGSVVCAADCPHEFSACDAILVLVIVLVLVLVLVIVLVLVLVFVLHLLLFFHLL